MQYHIIFLLGKGAGAVSESIEKLVFLVEVLLATMTMEAKRSSVTLTDEHNIQGQQAFERM